MRFDLLTRSKFICVVRLAGEESDGDYYRDSSSDGSNDYEIEKGIKVPGAHHSRFSWTNYEVPFGVSSLSISDENSAVQEGFSSDDSETGNSRDFLLFEFFEQDTPYNREPLADKASYYIYYYLVHGLSLHQCCFLFILFSSAVVLQIFDLSYNFPGLKTLRSCDLLPISWVSVAW